MSCVACNPYNKPRNHYEFYKLWQRKMFLTFRANLFSSGFVTGALVPDMSANIIRKYIYDIPQSFYKQTKKRNVF